MDVTNGQNVIRPTFANAIRVHNQGYIMMYVFVLSFFGVEAVVVEVVCCRPTAVELPTHVYLHYAKMRSV